MDYVYVCRSGENEELRYSIRSLVKNLPDVKVWVIGDAPSWYTGKLIKTESHRDKYVTVRRNLTILTETEEIGEDFVLMNDDFFIMQPMDSIRVWHRGSLSASCNVRKQLQAYSAYTQFLLATYKTITHLGVADPLDYELHTPLPMTKKSLADAVKRQGLWRSIAANQNGIGGEEHQDVKIYDPRSVLYREIEDLDTIPYLSCDDGSFHILLDRLMEAFPDPSPYEG